MERKIKIEYNPQRTYAVESGAGHNVGLMSSESLNDLLASVTKIYCGPEGDDSNNGLSEAAAVRTWARAIELAVTGDIEAIVFLPGFHSYFASHNLYGKKAIAMPGAKFVCIGTTAAANTSAQSLQKWFFNFSFC